MEMRIKSGKAILLSLLFLLSGCSSQPAPEQAPAESGQEISEPMSHENLSGTIPDELEYVPDGYTKPAEHPGTLEKLEYETWESFSYAEKTQKLTKTAWVYLPYGYDETICVDHSNSMRSWLVATTSPVCTSTCFTVASISEPRSFSIFIAS